MTKLTLKRSTEVHVDTELSQQDKYDLLDWLLGRMCGNDAAAYGLICKYPSQISLILKNTPTEGPNS
jgi:hypothetical protein